MQEFESPSINNLNSVGRFTYSAVEKERFFEVFMVSCQIQHVGKLLFVNLKISPYSLHVLKP